MEEVAIGLGVRDLFKNVYSKLHEKYDSKKIEFSDGVKVTVASEPDNIGTKFGYFKYKDAFLFNVNGKDWALSRGELYSGYPAERYDSDITVLEFPVNEIKATPENLRKEIENSSYFINSLFIGLEDGSLGLNMKKFGKELSNKFNNKFENFVVQEIEKNEDLISLSTLDYPVTQKMLYKPEFVEFLVNFTDGFLRN